MRRGGAGPGLVVHVVVALLQCVRVVAAEKRARAGVLLTVVYPAIANGCPAGHNIIISRADAWCWCGCWCWCWCWCVCVQYPRSKSCSSSAAWEKETQWPGET